MDFKYLLLAKSAEMSQESSFSALSFDFDCVKSPLFPCTFPISVLCRVEWEKGEVKGVEAELPFSIVEIDITGKNGKTILETPVVNKVPDTIPVINHNGRINPNIKMCFNFLGIIFPEPGVYKLKVKFSPNPNVYPVSLERSVTFYLEPINA